MSLRCGDWGWSPRAIRVGPKPPLHYTFTFLREENNGGDVVVVGAYVMEDATHSLVTVSHHKQPDGKHTPANTQEPMVVIDADSVMVQ